MTLEPGEIKMLNDPINTSDKPTLFVCMKCRPRGENAEKKMDESQTPGAILVAALEKHLTNIKPENFPARLQRVKCLGGCNHACTVAVAQGGKTTYMYGDLPGADRTDDVIAQLETYMRQYAESETGYVPPMDKPELFRPVLVRIPDAGWFSETGVVAPPGDKKGIAVPSSAKPNRAEPDDAPPFASPLRRAGEDA